MFVGLCFLFTAIWWRRILGLLSQLRGIFTVTGALFILLTLVVGVGAVNTKANVLYLFLSVLLSLMVFSGLVSSLTIRGLRVRRKLPAEVFAGEGFKVGVELRNLKPVISSYGVVVEDKLPEALLGDGKAVLLRIPPRSSAEGGYEVKALKRGVYRLERVELVSRFPFGFFCKRRRVVVRDELVVYPGLGEVLEEEFQRTTVPTRAMKKWSKEPYGDDEFRSLREFREGDNPKLIHWRSSAKRQKLMLREHDRRVPRSTLIVLDTSTAEEELLERAVSFVATLARDHTERGYQVTVAGLMPEPVVVSAQRKSELRAVYEALARMTPSEWGLGELLHRQRFTDTYECIVIVDMHSDRKVASVLGTMCSKLWRVNCAEGDLERVFRV